MLKLTHFDSTNYKVLHIEFALWIVTNVGLRDAIGARRKRKSQNIMFVTYDIFVL